MLQGTQAWNEFYAARCAGMPSYRSRWDAHRERRLSQSKERQSVPSSPTETVWRCFSWLPCKRAREACRRQLGAVKYYERLALSFTCAKKQETRNCSGALPCRCVRTGPDSLVPLRDHGKRSVRQSRHALNDSRYPRRTCIPGGWASKVLVEPACTESAHRRETDIGMRHD